ncbi:MAG TPA: hypothetical protein VKV79_02640 [Terriglobia bacterium]|nr:hypothetical protein [Terriglobia bacterium]
MSCRRCLFLGIAGLLCLSALARAQDASSQAAGGTTPSQSVGTPGSSGASSNSQLQPDTHPLAGAYLYTLGSAFEGRSYFEPLFSLSEVGESNPLYIANAKQTFSASTIPMAQLLLVHQSKTNEIEAGYVGGAFIYDNGIAPTATFHEFNVTDVKQFRRLQVSLSDIFSYLPEASFGFGGAGVFGGLGMGTGISGGLGSGIPGGLGLGVGAGLVNPMYSPNQSILTSQFGSYNNATIVQAVYRATARTEISVGGSYGMLQSGSSQAGFISGNNAMGFLGVQRSLTARDTLGLMYDYGTFNYVGLPESFRTQMLSLAYGRKITGRLALQLYGGPELLTYRTSLLSSFTRVAASGTGDLTYAFRRDTLGLFVSHYATGGSGVIAGTNTTMVSGSWTRQLTQRWSGTVYGGLARNTPLATSSVPSAGQYTSWFSNAILNRDMGRYLSLYVGYEYERQTTNSGPCTSAFCAGNLATQIIGVGITFKPHPIGL